MAAMKPRTGDGPLEVTKEGRGIVMRVPLEGGGGFGASEGSVAARGRRAFETETRGDEQVDDSDRAAPR